MSFQKNNKREKGHKAITNQALKLSEIRQSGTIFVAVSRWFCSN